MKNRYSKQILFDKIGERGQQKIADSFIVVIGCGALGSIIASGLVRAGVGRVRVIDRDFIEYPNLQRQILYDEEDIQQGLPKAIAAERHLKKINSAVDIEGVIADVNFTNVEELIKGANVLVDGLDNFETRYLINDVSLKYKIPWVYGGVIGSMGMSMTIVPGITPCLRCIANNPYHPGDIATCDTVGIVGPIAWTIGSIQSIEAIKLLVAPGDINKDLVIIDLWNNNFERIKLSLNNGCPSCGGNYEFLNGKYGIKTTTLCGQDAVQVANIGGRSISFDYLRDRLSNIGEVTCNEFMLRFSADSREIVVFRDGRAIIKNTNDESVAKGLYAKYIGV